MLSRVNHKNFVNLIGYCEEDEPFTRMMVFEYAPNGQLFEHLHGKLQKLVWISWLQEDIWKAELYFFPFGF